MTKDNKQLLGLLLEEVRKDTVEGQLVKHLGLCRYPTDLELAGTIKSVEHNRLINIIFEYPKKQRHGNGFFWPKGEAKPRIDFIKSKIKEYS